MVFLKCQ